MSGWFTFQYGSEAESTDAPYNQMYVRVLLAIRGWDKEIDRQVMLAFAKS